MPRSRIPKGWLFRIAHNTALRFPARRRARQNATHSDEDPDMIIDTVNTADARMATATSLRTFIGLPVAQRSSASNSDRRAKCSAYSSLTKWT